MSWLFLFMALVADPWTAAEVVQPDTLARRVGQPMIVQVGVPLLFRGAHITGAVFGGTGSKAAGLDELRLILANTPHDREIILYCGCCPWEKCPNVRPAFSVVRGMGFTKVSVLMIPENMAKDWVGKGYPAEKGVDNGTRSVIK